MSRLYGVQIDAHCVLLGTALRWYHAVHLNTINSVGLEALPYVCPENRGILGLQNS